MRKCSSSIRWRQTFEQVADLLKIGHCLHEYSVLSVRPNIGDELAELYFALLDVEVNANNVLLQLGIFVEERLSI